ncbi:MAG: peptidase domain-containing ABC transporter [Alphaproteobacteria bacterium]|nr:peptidase domain-containing ABC transporter [Alphaproteobacteria bacterium]
MIACVNLLALLMPLATMIIFNKVLGNQAYSTLHVIMIAVVVAYVFDMLLKGARGYLSTHTGARLDALLGTEMMGHLLRLPLRYFETNSSGAIAERIRQMDVIRNFMTGQMPLLLVDLVFSIILFAAIFIIDVRLGFIALAVVPIFAAISFYFDGTQRRYGHHNFMSVMAKTSSMNEMMNNALTIKSTGLESEMEAKHGELLAQTAWTSFQAQNINQHIYNLTNTIMALTSLGVLYAGALFIMEQQLTIGGLIAVNMLVGRTLAPIRQVTTAWHSFREAQDAFKRIQEVMAVATERTIADSATYPRLQGQIVLDRISFHYDPEQPPVIRDISLTLKPGTITGIVGSSGSGKSTLGKILIGVYTPSDGRVMMGDLDISHVAPASLRRDIGYVPQENQLFAGTVRDNILFGANNSNPAKAIMAAQFAGAHDFIQHLPQGYDTLLGERGMNISSGQRQLVCIARALAREPRMKSS